MLGKSGRAIKSIFDMQRSHVRLGFRMEMLLKAVSHCGVILNIDDLQPLAVYRVKTLLRDAVNAEWPYRARLSIPACRTDLDYTLDIYTFGTII